MGEEKTVSYKYKHKNFFGLRDFYHFSKFIQRNILTFEKELSE